MNAKQKLKVDDEQGRKPRSDGEQSRERLLLAGMRLFGEQGFSKTSTREIAQAASVNVAAISYYFGDKAGLYETCFSAICKPIQDNIPLYDRPDFTLRESLQGYYQQMIAPLLGGADAELYMRLFYREMLEPTGIWQREIENNIKPEHMALVGVLCRHLELRRPDNRAHQLAYAVASMCSQILVWHDVIRAITPDVVASPKTINAWMEQLVDFSEAMVEAEKSKRRRDRI